MMQNMPYSQLTKETEIEVLEPHSKKEVEEVIPWKRINIDVESPNTVETQKGQRNPTFK
jgi:hypothetical protein